MKIETIKRILAYIHTDNPKAKSTLTIDGKPVDIIPRRKAANMENSTQLQWYKWLWKEDWKPCIQQGWNNTIHIAKDITVLVTTASLLVGVVIGLYKWLS